MAGCVTRSHQGVFEPLTKVPAFRKFTTLVGADATAVLVSMLGEEFCHYVERRVFGGREEDPYVSGGLVDD